MTTMSPRSMDAYGRVFMGFVTGVDKVNCSVGDLANGREALWLWLPRPETEGAREALRRSLELSIKAWVEHSSVDQETQFFVSCSSPEVIEAVPIVIQELLQFAAEDRVFVILTSDVSRNGCASRVEWMKSRSRLPASQYVSKVGGEGSALRRGR